MSSALVPSGSTDTNPRAFAPRPLLREEWPLTLVCAGMPLCYLLGIHAFVWVVPGIVFGLRLFLRRAPLRVPLSALPLALLVAWIPLSAWQLAPSALPLFGYRWLLYVATLACFLWIVNTSPDDVPTRRIVQLLAWLWIILVAFAFVALALPHVSIASPFQTLLPQGIASQPYVNDLTRIRFAEVQTLGALEVGRPAAPMAYSNGWGSTLGLLTPFFVCEYIAHAPLRRRRFGVGMLLVASIPVIASLNRGLWLSLGVGMLYVALRRAYSGNWRMLVWVGLGGLAVVSLVLMSTLGSTVQQRFDTQEESNNARTALYEAAYELAQDSPLVGWGAPVEADGLWRDVGTHGLFWYVMVVYGFPALAFLILWLGATCLVSSRAPTDVAQWAHVAIAIFAIQVLFYGLLPQIVIVGIAAGISWRERVLTPVPAQ